MILFLTGVFAITLSGLLPQYSFSMILCLSPPPGKTLAVFLKNFIFYYPSRVYPPQKQLYIGLFPLLLPYAFLESGESFYAAACPA